MSKNKLLILFSVVLLLGVGVLFSSEESSEARESVSVLSHVNGENVSKIVISKAGKEQILDCLLYTSPSPRDRTRSRMPSSA